MQPTETFSPQELAQLHRETRIENRAYAHAQERAAADSYQDVPLRVREHRHGPSGGVVEVRLQLRPVADDRGTGQAEQSCDWPRAGDAPRGAEVNAAQAEGSILARIERVGFQAAANLTPTYHSKTWCDQGHMMNVDAPACPTCTTAIAELLSDVLERLHLGLIPALDPATCHDCGGPAPFSICDACLTQRGA